MYFSLKPDTEEKDEEKAPKKSGYTGVYSSGNYCDSVYSTDSTLHDVLRRSWSSFLVVTASTSEFVSETRTRRALDTGALPRGERGGLLLFVVVIVVVGTAAW
ncbi:PREDICTED: uncharacterized protein LOC105449996 [Wasmannia auropunctata]|uniref:uncharacterized protein LOC105449996 n=1 Tax=Wasmannia auropunctata TaxID=64793 RepID=UPI0005EE7F72|nr:PREDICTED: uncharacterized protein LOC105449996 [Wasmannia auropunctata]